MLTVLLLRVENSTPCYNTDRYREMLILTLPFHEGLFRAVIYVIRVLLVGVHE